MRKIIKGDIDLKNLYLTELFDLSDVEVTGRFNCMGNNLTNLKGSPHTVNGDFDCYNNNLTSLEGAPHTVNGSFYCDQNNLTSLDGIPKIIGEDFWISKNLKNIFPEKYIRTLSVITGAIHYVTANGIDEDINDEDHLEYDGDYVGDNNDDDY